MAKSLASRLIDEIYESLGTWGKYQIFQLAMILSLAWPSSQQLYSIVYIGYQPPLRCHHPENSSYEGFSNYTNSSDERPYYPTCKKLFEKTNVTSCPHGYDYDLPKDASFTTEWDLVCDMNYLSQLTQTIFVVGQAVGATFFTFISDKYGRQKASILCQLCMLIVSTGAIFVKSPITYTVTKFVTGFAQQGHVTMFHVMTMEILPTTKRTLTHLLNGLSWTVFLCLQVAVAYLLRDVSWKYTQIYMTGASLLILIPNMVVLDESIRWLFANEKVTEVRKVIDNATRRNKANPAEVEEKMVACIEETAGELHSDLDESDISLKGTNTEKERHDDSETVAHHKGTLFDLLKNRRLRITTAVMFFAWIVNSLTSFGLSLTASKLSGDRFLNYFLFAIMPFPSGLTSYFTLIKFGRKATTIIFHALTGVSLIAAVVLSRFLGESASGAVVAFTILGRFGIASTWDTLFLYTPELYPTNLRSLGLGISSSASRIGGMLAPFSNIVIDYIPWLPGTVYGCSCLIVCLLTLYLPETLNRELPQTIDEIKMWNKSSKGSAKNRDDENCDKYDGEHSDILQTKL